MTVLSKSHSFIFYVLAICNRRFHDGYKETKPLGLDWASNRKKGLQIRPAAPSTTEHTQKIRNCWHQLKFLKYSNVQINVTVYLLSRENYPIFSQHGSELMNEIFFKTAPCTDREMTWVMLLKYSKCLSQQCEHCDIIYSILSSRSNNTAWALFTLPLN